MNGPPRRDLRPYGWQFSFHPTGAATVATRLFRLLGWMTLRDTFRLIRLLKSKDQNHHLQPSLRAVPALWQASQHHALAG